MLDEPKSQAKQEDKLLQRNTVRMWRERIKNAKKFFEKDFKRMQENMEFAAGIQWKAQDSIQSEQYVANFVNREVNQKVANLYAKDPKAVFNRRKRLDFSIWDGQVETMQAAHQTIMQAQHMAQQNPMVMMQPQVVQAQHLLADIDQGQKWQALVDRVGKTLETLYQYQCDTQSPDFKYQMKQLVRRVVTTGVGYVRLNFSRMFDHALTASGTDDSFSMRIKRARNIMEQIDDDKVLEDDPRRQQLEQLFSSVSHSLTEGDISNIEERLEFDFPAATSIIVDPKCRSLKGFIGARWIAQQYILPLEEVNAYFETDITAGGELVTYSEDGVEKIKSTPEPQNDTGVKSLVMLWEVFDITTKTSFHIVDGWKDWVKEPDAVEPGIIRFWPIFSLTFNDIEMEHNTKVHIYPPSDVELIRHPQKEWNRSREELRKHRKGNRPWYATLSGWLTEEDSDNIANHESNQLVAFKGLPPNMSLKDAIQAFQAAPIDPAVYATEHLLQDTSLCIGTNTAQQQQPQRHVAATPAVIQEQARMQGSNSNVDDLDDLLSELARAGGEMLLKEFRLETVKRVVGNGASWPEENREQFLDEVYLDVVAASSGRPNKAVDIANWQQIGPLLLQAGANRWGLIKQTINVLDANLDPIDFAPTMPPAAPQGQQAPQHSPAPRHPGTVGQHQGGIGMPVPMQHGG